MVEELLARFIIGGLVILVATEALTATGDGDTLPMRFRWSMPWMALRYTLIAGTVLLCLSVLD